MAPRLSLPPGEIHLWLADYAAIDDERLHAAYRELLDPAEREQEPRFYFARDRRRYLVTRALVRTVLSRYADVDPAAWVFTPNAYGRPEIANAGVAGLSFNISHTHSMIVLGVTRDRALGVDVENARAREVSLDIARHYFAPDEVAALATVPEHGQQERFFEYWTFKESYIKARGMGLSLPLDKFSFHYPDERGVALSIHPELADDPSRWDLWQFRPEPGYLVAVCAERGPEPPRVVIRRAVPLAGEQLCALAPSRVSASVSARTRSITTAKESSMNAFVFPGQGSQKKGMGQGLFDEVREYAAVEKEVDAIVGYSMRRLCLEDPDNRLKETQYTQPSLYVVNALHYYKAVAEGATPSYVAGHSLGEYNALLAAGVFDFLTGLRLVQKRGELMAQAKNGGMAAVIGLDAGTVARVIQDNGLTTIDVANFNTPTQTVVSGPVDDIKRAIPVFDKAGAQMCIPLQVSAAFHSRYMADAGKAFADFLAPLSFSAPRIPVIANVTAQPYPTANPSETVKSLLAEQITHSVRWSDSVRYLLGQGVTQFTEIGPGNVLTRMVQQIQQQQKAAA
jgi:malonyl CoA-acyl carrier protein transacylase